MDQLKRCQCAGLPPSELPEKYRNCLAAPLAAHRRGVCVCVLGFMCVLKGVARAWMMLVDRQMDQHLSVCACVGLCARLFEDVWACACACRRAERCENVGGKNKRKEVEREVANKRWWLPRERYGSCVGNKIEQETNERSMTRKKKTSKSSNGVEWIDSTFLFKLTFFCFYVKAEKREQPWGM